MMCRHLILREPTMTEWGMTRCGRKFKPPARRGFGRKYRHNVAEVDCKTCLALASVPYGTRSPTSRHAGRACVIDGLRVPLSSLRALQRALKPSSCDGPPPGPPYPWQSGVSKREGLDGNK